MTIETANNATEWDTFLSRQRFRPFLQSWTMGEVYRAVGQEPVRLILKEGTEIIGICQAIVVPAKRGRHLAISYGPILTDARRVTSDEAFVQTLKNIASDKNCSFIRMSPFWPKATAPMLSGALDSPLHLLAEHIWYLPLTKSDAWNSCNPSTTLRTGLQPATVVADGKVQGSMTEEELLSPMRKTTRNLIRRAEKEGVVVEASSDPVRDVEVFIALHDETRKRHGFTPYTNDFFRAQVAHFAPRKECTVYLARYQGEVIASSIHMHAYGETSYHHGASTHKYDKIPASYLLQWTAIKDALSRGDHVYNFWGIAPEGAKNHPFSGVTLFKTGFGGTLLELTHCMDIPVNASYRLTRAFEIFRKWKRGF